MLEKKSLTRGRSNIQGKIEASEKENKVTEKMGRSLSKKLNGALKANNIQTSNKKFGVIRNPNETTTTK